MRRFLRVKLSGLWRNRFGGVLVYAAISAPVIIGFSAANGDTIAVDTSNSPNVEVTVTRPPVGSLSQVVFGDQFNIQGAPWPRRISTTAAFGPSILVSQAP